MMMIIKIIIIIIINENFKRNNQMQPCKFYFKGFGILWWMIITEILKGKYNLNQSQSCTTAHLTKWQQG